jgi:hypothetical protein
VPNFAVHFYCFLVAWRELVLLAAFGSAVAVLMFKICRAFSLFWCLKKCCFGVRLSELPRSKNPCRKNAEK